MKLRFRDFIIPLATIAPLLGVASWLAVRRPHAAPQPITVASIRELARTRRFDEAQARLEVYLRDNPADSYANLLMGEIATDRPDPRPDLALDHLGKVRPESPEKAALVRFFMGKAHYQDSRYDLAEASWREAIRLNPAVPEAGWALVELLNLEGRVDEAHDLGLRLHEIEPDPRDRVRFLIELGLLDVDRTAPGSIVLLFEPLAKVVPENLAVARTLGLALIHDSRVDRGVEVLREALRLHPDSPDAWDAWLTGLDDGGRMEEYTSEFARMPHSFLSDVRFAKHEGLDAQGTHDWPRAARAYGRADAATPHDGVILYRLSRALRFAGKLAESKRVEARLKDHQAAYKQINGVITELTSSGRLGYDPRPELYQRLAGLREQMGRADDALAWHRLVLRDRPDDATSLAAVARLAKPRDPSLEGPKLSTNPRP